MVILTSPSVQILVILTPTNGPILVIDFFSQPNSGHIDVFWTTTITRISASEANLRLKKAIDEFLQREEFLEGGNERQEEEHISEIIKAYMRRRGILRKEQL